MRKYHEQMDSRMFDFRDYYSGIAHGMPNDANIAEVGVADGASAIFLAETLLNLGKTFTLHLVDSLDYGGKDQLLTIAGHVHNAGLSKWIRILPKDSLNASCHFPDQLFHFVFIDASHQYEPTKADIRLWWRKIRHHGVLAGHDYNVGIGEDVFRAVNETIPEKAIHAYSTEKGYGVWAVTKTPELVLL